jgi:aldose 1-epimerase
MLIIMAVSTSSCIAPTSGPGDETKKGNMTINKELAGEHEGKHVWLYTLNNGNGITAKIMNYGGILKELHVPGRTGVPEDIVLGFDGSEPYFGEHPYFGALIGRYGNRIARGEFSVDGIRYSLARNNGNNHLHGGVKGFDKVIWDILEVTGQGEIGVMLKYTSADGEEGYPGILWATVVYTLTDDNELRIEYRAESSRATPVNLTHHSYFNLKGAGNGNILDHILTLYASKYTPVDEELIPTGELRTVEGTPFDFREGKKIGADIEAVPGGYDHNFVLDNPGELRIAAQVEEPISGRQMKVFTTEPGIQFYSGNFLEGNLSGKHDSVYHQHYGFCLEAQHFPDSPNRPEFPDVILRPGEQYYQLTIYQFETLPEQ